MNNLAKCFSWRRVWWHSGLGIIENTQGMFWVLIRSCPEMGSECTLVVRHRASDWAAPSRQPQT